MDTHVLRGKMEYGDVYFQRNLEILKDVHPSLAFKVQKAEFNHSFSLGSDGKGSVNLMVNDFQEPKSFYQEQSEELEWYAHQPLDSIDVLFIHGLGLGLSYNYFSSWLRQKKEHYLVYLVDSVVSLKLFLSTNFAHKILTDAQVQIHLVEDGISTSQLRYLAWFFVFDQIGFISSLFHHRYKSQETTEFRNDFLTRFSNAQQNLYEVLNGGAPFFKSFYQNSYSLPTSKPASCLYNKCKNIPLIICGAGPSLEKNVNLLKTLRNKALIYAGGSSVNALLKYGIVPHFSGHIDPNPLQAQRLFFDKAYGVPRFFGGRLHKDALKNIHGETLYVRNATYKLSEWIEDELGFSDHENDRLDPGHGVSNWGVSLGAALGCNPIILVGMDLAFTGEQSYCKHVEKQTFDLSTLDPFERTLIDVKDIYGKPVKTVWKWMMEAQWYESFSKRFPQVNLINATEGGIGCPGVENLSLEEVTHNYLKRELDVENHFRSILISMIPSTCTTDQVTNLLEKVHRSFSRCADLYQSLSDEVSSVYKKLLIGDDVPKSLHTAKQAILQAELIDEIAFTHHLESLEQAYDQFLERKRYELEKEQRMLSDRVTTMRILQMQAEKFVYLSDLCQNQRKYLKEAMEKVPPPFFKECEYENPFKTLALI